MATGTEITERPATLSLDCCDSDFSGDNEVRESLQGPHDWRKRLRPVQSPIKSETPEFMRLNGEVKENIEEKLRPKERPLPPWKCDLIEKNKKVARLVRRESSGRSKRNSLVRRESSGRSKKSQDSESPSTSTKRKVYKHAAENSFTSQVVNEAVNSLHVPRKRISPANSFKAGSSASVRRTPSDKVVDLNDPATKKRVERVKRARLYLLQQTGPNSFLIVGDSPEHKFRVIIGPQTCSCAKGPHCVHVLFVMLRVFQVSELDPCLWSRQLKNYEVENLFRMYHDKRTMRIEKQMSLTKSRKSTSSTDRSCSPSPEPSIAPSESDAGSVREEDDTCPICLLEMVEGESLLKCDGCQNKLHHHCVTVWFDECKRVKEPLICPLCRAKWRNSNVQLKLDDQTSEPPEAPPNTRAPSPQHEPVGSRLPYPEPIPAEYAQLAAAWIEILGENLVPCLFSRNWSIRETGLKHLGKEVMQELKRLSTERDVGASLSRSTRLLECCCSVLAFMCNDPVYKVYVGCLKVLRTLLSHISSRNEAEQEQLQHLFKKVLAAIIIKCTDGNRRMSQLSLSTMMELAKGQNGELTVGREISDAGMLGLGGMVYVVKCVTEPYNINTLTWQSLLGRLYIIEKLIVEFPAEFLPRQQPDGASSESSLELIGALSAYEEERPQNYDRLLAIARFSTMAVGNAHARISRVARRVFLLAARHAAHLETLVADFYVMLGELELKYKKSLQQQLTKIVNDFQMSERIVQELHRGSGHVDFNTDRCVTLSDTPLSTPRCNSPVTTNSEHHSESGSVVEKNAPLLAPPNTPIRDHREYMLKQSHARRSFDFLDEEQDRPIQTSKMSKSLDALDTIDSQKKTTSRSKSPKVRSRVRCQPRTPQHVGPVLETDIDEAIRQEEVKKMNSSLMDTTQDGSDVRNLSLSTSIQSQEEWVDVSAPKLPVSPVPRLSQNIETDIDSVEPVFDNIPRFKLIESETSPVNNAEGTSQNSNSGDLSLTSCHSERITSPNGHSTPLDVTPKIKTVQVPTTLSLKSHDQLGSATQLSPCAHAKKQFFTELDAFQTPQRHSMITESKSCSKLANCSTTSVFPMDTPQASCSMNKFVKSSKNIRSRNAAEFPTANQKAMMTDDLLEVSPITPAYANEKPVTFQSEVAQATPKNSPSQTLDKADDDDCPCKEEVEKEEALAIAKAMEVSTRDPPKPCVPGLTPMDSEQVITIMIQPDNCDGVDDNANPPLLYYENVHWVKGPLLGTGAFSTCYQARDVRTGIIMAMKQISFCRNSKSEQEKVIESITEEIHMMAKLNHPNIVRIMGATRQGCHFNMFVEWMPGGSISYLLGQYGAFSEDVITNYMLQILRGLAYLHDNQVLHRDLKGANLLIDSTGQRLRIGDFGAAARLASRATAAGEFQGQLLGTIAFMAPEVLRGENYGRACDVWGVGCCMIEMVTTKPPWNATDVSNHLALIFKIANSTSTPPVPDKLSPPLRDMALRCLEPDKAQRPTAKDLLIHPLFTQYMQKK